MSTFLSVATAIAFTPFAKPFFVFASAAQLLAVSPAA